MVGELIYSTAMVMREILIILKFLEERRKEFKVGNIYSLNVLGDYEVNL